MFALSRMQNFENSLWYFLILGLSNSVNLLFDKSSHIIFQHFIRLLKVVIYCFVQLTSFFRFFLKYRRPQIFILIKIDPERLPKFSPYILFSRQRWYLYWLSPRQNPYIIFTNKMEMGLLQFFVVVNSQICSHFKCQIIQKNSRIMFLQKLLQHLLIPQWSNLPQQTLIGSLHKFLIFELVPIKMNTHLFSILRRQSLNILCTVVMPKSLVGVQRIGKNRSKVRFLQPNERIILVFQQYKIIHIWICILLRFLLIHCDGWLYFVHSLWMKFLPLALSLDESITYWNAPLLHLQQTSSCVLFLWYAYLENVANTVVMHEEHGVQNANVQRGLARCLRKKQRGKIVKRTLLRHYVIEWYPLFRPKLVRPVKINFRRPSTSTLVYCGFRSSSSLYS